MAGIRRLGLGELVRRESYMPRLLSSIIQSGRRGEHLTMGTLVLDCAAFAENPLLDVDIVADRVR